MRKKVGRGEQQAERDRETTHFGAINVSRHGQKMQ